MLPSQPPPYQRYLPTVVNQPILPRPRRQGCCLAVIDPQSQQLMKLEQDGRVGNLGASLGTHMFSERNSIAVRHSVDLRPASCFGVCMYNSVLPLLCDHWPWKRAGVYMTSTFGPLRHPL